MCSHSRQDRYNAVGLTRATQPTSWLNLIRLFPVIPSCAGMSSIETMIEVGGSPSIDLGGFIEYGYKNNCCKSVTAKRMAAKTIAAKALAAKRPARMSWFTVIRPCVCIATCDR